MTSGKPLPEMDYIDYGLGAFQAEAIRGYSQPGKFDLEFIYQDLIKRNELAAIEIQERFYEIGSETGLRQLEEHLATNAHRRVVSMEHIRRHLEEAGQILNRSTKSKSKDHPGIVQAQKRGGRLFFWVWAAARPTVPMP